MAVELPGPSSSLKSKILGPLGVDFGSLLGSKSKTNFQRNQSSGAVHGGIYVRSFPKEHGMVDGGAAMIRRRRLQYVFGKLVRSSKK